MCSDTIHDSVWCAERRGRTPGRSIDAAIVKDPTYGCDCRLANGIYHRSLSKPPRRADAFWISRHVAKSSCSNVIFCAAENSIEVASGNIALRWSSQSSPFQPWNSGSELSALFERKLFDRSLDFDQTHIGKSNYRCAGLIATGLPVVPGSCFGFSVAISLICLVIATDWNVSAFESCFKSSWIFAALSSPITILTFR
jgi:hypothetical protein